ncbi:HAD-IC family P-type ATPase [Altererythrobacter sp. N1]|nr:HAD-IC family P-type ATPase [Altererythrobacter sp. N1]
MERSSKADCWGPARDAETGKGSRQLLAVDGLFCGGCARGLEHRLRKLEGVLDAGVHYLTASAFVHWNPRLCSLREIEACIASAGYRMVERFHLPVVLARLSAATEVLTYRLAIGVFFAMWSMGAAFVLYFGSGVPPSAAWWLALASGACLVPVIVAGRAILTMGWRSLGLRSYTIDTLISGGVLGAILISGLQLMRGSSSVYFDAAAMLIVLRLTGQWIETRVRAGSIAALIELEAAAPETVWPASGGPAVSISELGLGDRVRVPAGAQVTIDGRIVAGRSRLNTAYLTGESAPLRVGEGDLVEAGCLNLDRQLVLEVARPFDDRLIDRMGGRVALELAAKGEQTSIDDSVLAVLARATPLLAALALGLGLLQGVGIEGALARALTTLIVICPCALAIARPLASLAVVGAGRKCGLRIANPSSLDALARPGTVVFDKTGTLTSGTLQVTRIVSLSHLSTRELLSLAARAETGIDHPIARAIVAAAGANGPGGLRLARKAIGTDLDGKSVEVAGIAPDGDCQTRAATLEVRLEGVAVGQIYLDDQVDPGVAPLIGHLRRHGARLQMATGDALPSALNVGRAVGLEPEEIAASLSPLEKADLVRALARPVVFVGDGVNDAPAMAASDCSISVQRAHAAATASASVAILEGGLERVREAMVIARQYRSTGRRNAALALGYNAMVIPLAVMGTMSPLLAALTMTASSMLAIANSLRVGKARPHGAPIRHEQLTSDA